MTLPNLSMGTLMGVSMLIVGIALVALPQARTGAAIRWLQLIIGVLALASGAWQLLWYATRHLGTGWGAAATLSGAAFLAAALTLLPRAPDRRLRAMRWPIALLLVGLGLFYGWAISQL